MVPPPGYDPGSSDFQSVAMTTSAKAANCLERVTRIELVISAWQADVLPLALYPQIVWWMLQDSNLWPTACRAVALPSELNILGALDWTRTSMLLYSHQHLKLACIPFHHKGFLIAPTTVVTDHKTTILVCCFFPLLFYSLKPLYTCFK
jgi:hypothetical protein